MNPISTVKNVNKLRREAKQMQDDMKNVTAEGTSKKNLIKVTLNGLQEIVDVQIDDSLMESKDDMIKHLKDAMSDAQKKVQKEISKGMDMSKLKDMFGM